MEKTRWEQRFENFEKAYGYFSDSVNDPGFSSFSVREQQGVIQQFEILLELSWKVMKDYLSYSGVSLESVAPKNIIREAFSQGLIHNGQVWIDMLNLRNILSHAYGETYIEDAMAQFENNFIQCFTEFKEVMKVKKNG